MSASLSIENCINETCPWSGEAVSPDALALYRGHVVGFCNVGCRDKFIAATTSFDELLADMLEG